MRKTIKLKDAVGTALAHDITEIRPGEFKGPAFRKGHVVCNEDICHLQRLGKNHLYLIDLEEDEIHENEAAATLARALSGEGIAWDDDPSEGKIKLFADRDGLLTVDAGTLAEFNMVEEVMCASLQNNTPVKKGEQIAATRAIPLIMKRAPIEAAAAIASRSGGILNVRPLRHAKAGLIVTGNEVYHGLIEDGFAPILSQKITNFGSEVISLDFAPDSDEAIAEVILSDIKRGCDILLVSGGMSVDPDDVTRQGIRMAGATELYYGAAVLPGAMFLVAYFDDIPLLGVPACGLHHRTTALDLVLPRVLSGEHIGKWELAALGHGGLCRDCPECNYPRCSFGK
ncbi:Molybdenum cofactor cytidylyltransferase [uncultured Desulfobacterium sp.]|uniref:Molybdopterin molybdenumtransferase n=1 Tax=uncultured Desulfobacterium sp. TaxID=201089 RepID=A0A445MQI9_9BACT|nr:Molybdenum cofactor cytidylyltransferase [uncultured Desulfobacterium sp.]